ncbi:MAG: tetratricopeptide repeat protein [Bdellovibrio sp.]|nr:tetratricopeptide repeat protein [Bdellovibrio sp.]
MKTKWAFLLLALIQTVEGQAASILNSENVEIQARRVDRVALQSQDSAASRLKSLIKKYKSQAQEGVLLMRLAQVYQEGAEIEFRISYGRSPKNKSNTAIQLGRYRGRLQDAVNTINELLIRFPRYPLVDEALFIRAKAKEELGQKDSAREDYLNLTQNYRDSKHLLASYMALADLVIEKNNHAEAIQYLNQIEAHPESSFFPFALYKLAWAHFNLRNIPRALGYLERHVHLYLNKSRIEKLSASDIALRENSLMDMATFYFDGYELGNLSYTLSAALNYFQKQQPGELLGKMILRFAKLLRSRQREADLALWKTEMIQKVGALPEAMDVVITLFDHLWDQRRVSEIPAACSDIQTLFRMNAKNPALTQSESYVSARNALTQRAEVLQDVIVKQGGKSSTPELQLQMKVLEALYSTFIQIVPETDPRIVLAHYNLAETLFKISNFNSATDNYRWILQHWNKVLKFQRSEVELKAIASRYESLHSLGAIPKQITPAKPDQLRWDEFKEKLPPQIREWTSWIDSYSGGSSESAETFNSFQFEANRTIYQQGGVRAAIERMVRFSEKNRTSKYAIPSQELVLDSLLLTQNWPEIQRTTRYFLSRAPKSTPFYNRLQQLSADAAFKQVEENYQSGAYDKLIAQAKDYILSYPKNERVADALFLMANASLAKKDEKLASEGYSQLIQNHPKSALASKARLARGQLSLAKARFDLAAQDFESYLNSENPPMKTSPKETQNLWSQLFTLKWISGQKAASCKQFDHETGNSTFEECLKFWALSELNDTHSEASATEKTLPREAKQRALKGSEQTRALWALLELGSDSDLDLRSQLHLIRSLATHWDKLDSSIRLTMLQQMNSVIPPKLEAIRLEIKKATPMNRASAKAVSIRAEWIKEFEETIAKVMKLPWYRLQASGLMQLALAYDDFVISLQSAPIPKDLSAEESVAYQKSVYEIVEPFSKKRDDIAERAMTSK